MKQSTSSTETGKLKMDKGSCIVEESGQFLYEEKSFKKVSFPERHSVGHLPVFAGLILGHSCTVFYSYTFAAYL